MITKEDWEKFIEEIYWGYFSSSSYDGEKLTPEQHGYRIAGIKASEDSNRCFICHSLPQYLIPFSAGPSYSGKRRTSFYAVCADCFINPGPEKIAALYEEVFFKDFPIEN